MHTLTYKKNQPIQLQFGRKLPENYPTVCVIRLLTASRYAV